VHALPLHRCTLLNDGAALCVLQVATAQSGQMIVPLSWARVFMSLSEQPVGSAFGAGYGFDVVGALFRGRRFFEKGGDSLMHQTRTGFLPGEGVAVFVAANMEGSPVQGVYVNGIRNALLDIFTGADEATVEANWAPLEAQAASIRTMVSGLPNRTLILPLRGGANLTLALKCSPTKGCFFPQPQLTALRAAAECCALAPPMPLSYYVGTYHDGYYGTLEVTRPTGLTQRPHSHCISALFSLWRVHCVWCRSRRP
jgi:hypothetical protein